MKNLNLSDLRRRGFSTSLLSLVASIGFISVAPSLHADVKYVSAAAPSGAGIWVNAAYWEASGVPTSSEDVVFDFKYNASLSQFALHTGTGPFIANSLTFGSASGLGAFYFQSGNSGTATRTLGLTSGGITVTSDVTGTQYIGTAPAPEGSHGMVFLDAVDGSFEITNNSTQQLVIAARLSDAITGTTVTYGGTGAISLNGSSLYTGATTISAGANVTISNTTALGIDSAVLIGTGATLDVVNINNLSIGGLNDIAGAGGNVTRSSTSGTRTLILSGAGSYAFSGTLTTAGTASLFALSITGGGTQRLSGDNTYGGTTTITNGTLLANNTSGFATGTGNVSVGADGILGGTGSVASASSSATTAMFSPGNDGAGTFTVVGNLSLQNGAVFTFELGTVSDKIVVGGQLRGSTNADELVFNFADAGGITTGTPYTLFDYSGGSLNNFDVTDFSLSASSISAGFVLDTEFGTDGWFIDTVNKLVQVQFSAIPAAAIPEPATVGRLAGLLSLGSTIGLRRKRQTA